MTKKELVEFLNTNFADGNGTKMREAVRKILWCLEWMFNNTDDKSVQSHLCDPIALARAALDEPARNCDVGTAEEQTARFRKFCSAHKYLGSDFSYMCKGFGKGRCPFSNSHTKSQCEFAWSQMPYEREAAI